MTTTESKRESMDITLTPYWWDVSRKIWRGGTRKSAGHTVALRMGCEARVRGSMEPPLDVTSPHHLFSLSHSTYPLISFASCWAALLRLLRKCCCCCVSPSHLSPRPQDHGRPIVHGAWPLLTSCWTQVDKPRFLHFSSVGLLSFFLRTRRTDWKGGGGISLADKTPFN